MVAISAHRFLPHNQKLGLDSDNQNKMIGTISVPQALNLSLEWFFKGWLFVKPFSGLSEQKYT